LFDTSGKTLAEWYDRKSLVEARGMPRALLYPMIVCDQVAKVAGTRGFGFTDAARY